MYEAAQRNGLPGFLLGWYRQYEAMAGLCQVGDTFTPPSEEQSAIRDLELPSVGFINCEPASGANTLSGYGRTSRWQLASICQKTGLSSGWSSTAYRHQVEANGHSGPSGA